MAKDAPAVRYPTVPSDSSWHKPATDFLSIIDPEPVYIVSELVQEGVLMLVHGEPRALKSWQALEIALAVTTGTNAFNLPRFTIPEPVPVMYISQEDSPRMIRWRFRLMLKGRELLYNRSFPYPELLHISAHENINLDNPVWCQTLAYDLKNLGVKLLILDPIRRFSSTVDKGPGEVSVLTTNLRQICTTSGASIMIVHHDVKPSKDVSDDRRLGHRASGGDWFAACESPMHCQATNEEGKKVAKAVCQDFKHSNDPDPFKYELMTDDPENPSYFQVIGTEEFNESPDELTTIVTAYLKDNPGHSITALQRLLKVNKNNLLDTLNLLRKTGQARWVAGPRRAHLWELCDTPVPPLTEGSL